MKRFLALFLVLCSLSSFACASVDLSGMSFSDLVALREQVNMALWASDEWQAVEVPKGVYTIGKEIPAGKWTISAVNGAYVDLRWCDKLDESGVKPSSKSKIYVYDSLYSPYSIYYNSSKSSQLTWNLKDGQYLIVDDGRAVFTPFIGSPNLGFK